MTHKIVFIAPDEKLAARAKGIIADLDGEIAVYQGSMEEGLTLAKMAVENGANIIISRGRTGNLIKESSTYLLSTWRQAVLISSTPSTKP